MTCPNHRSGFALLMTLLVVSVIISAVLAILDVTIKQVRLASSAQASETAFHAANAGAECGQFVRRNQFVAMEAGNNASASCFGATQAVSRASVARSGSTGQVHLYQYQFSWGTAPDQRCSQVSTMVIVSSAGSVTTLTATEMRAVIPTYPNTSMTCPAGGICTVMSARGYNRTCPPSLTGAFPAGTVQREVLLQF